MTRVLAPLVAVLLTAVPAIIAFGGPAPGQIKNIVTFGDSYSDVGAPADGGDAWPTYAAEYGPFSLYPYAKDGAACSNYLTDRPFPSVFESELPNYFAEVANGSLVLNSYETMYTLWIGTNDVGVNELLTGSQTPGVTLVNTTSCAINWVTTLYSAGARNFMFQNMLPLQLTVLYSNYSWPNRYYTAERNSTEWNVFMTELTNSANMLTRLMLEALAPSLPGAHIGIFDSFGLFTDMYNNPANYLNGTAPLNVTSCVNKCVYPVNGNTSAIAPACTTAEGTDRDSFLWYDELHPSEQSDRMVAREISGAITRRSSNWTTWLS